MKKLFKRFLIISQVLGWSALVATACTDENKTTNNTSVTASKDSKNSENKNAPMVADIDKTESSAVTTQKMSEGLKNTSNTKQMESHTNSMSSVETAQNQSTKEPVVPPPSTSGSPKTPTATNTMPTKPNTMTKGPANGLTTSVPQTEKKSLTWAELLAGC